MARVLIETYGCTLNQADSDIMESMLKNEGHSVERGTHSDSTNYDYVIVNTCTVKTPTEQKILHKLGKLSSLKNRLIVTGCMASANSDRITKAIPEASIITTSNTSRITDALADISKGIKVDYKSYNKSDKITYLDASGAAIARIPISEGCLSSCSFCETKFARGPLKSFSQELILKAAEMAVRKGARELEFTSQDVGAYGADKRTNIAELVSAATDIPGNFRIRVGMLNPEHLGKYIDDLILAYKSEKIYKFAHLPVQSGSNKVLREMKRRYTAEQFKAFAAELESKVDDISIATDMIVGYPTETEADFGLSMRLIGDTRLSRINISKFGARPHAMASKLKQIRNEVIKARCIRMYRLSRKAEVESLTKIVGQVRKVLVTESKDGSLLARDSSYREIAVTGGGVGLGQFVNVQITGNTSACLIGKVVGNNAIGKIEIAAINQ